MPANNVQPPLVHVDPATGIPISDARYPISEERVRLSTSAFSKGSAICKPFGNTNANAGANFTYVVQFPAEAPFVGVRLIYLNYSVTTDVVIDIAKVAPSPTNANTGSSLTWQTVTFGGATSGVVPMGVQVFGASPINVAPGILKSDLMFVSSLLRTDTPENKPLLQVRTLHTLASNVTTFGTTATTAAANALTGGRQYGTQITAGDAVNTISSLAPTTGVTYCQPCAIEFFYGVPAVTVAASADSLFSGYLGAGDQLGPILRGVNGVSKTTKVVSPCLFSITGQGRRASYQVQLQIIDEIRPEVLIIAPWSPNDAISATEIDQSWAEVLEVVSICQRRRIVPIITTQGPVNSSTGAENALRVKQNNRVMAMAGVVPIVDLNNVYEDPLNPGQMRPEYYIDGTHLTDAGYIAGGSAIASILSTIL